MSSRARSPRASGDDAQSLMNVFTASFAGSARLNRSAFVGLDASNSRLSVSARVTARAAA
eukprot:15127-Pelagococcus_subviridis.AAC.2